jgi:hypothetical protein
MRRRVALVAGSLLAAASLVPALADAQRNGAPPYRVGGGASSGALDQIERSVTRPLPQAPPPAPVPRPDSVWVPDRSVATPGGTVHVPGHWERRLPTGDHHVPPLVVCTPGGQCAPEPGGTRPPPEQRQSP